MPNCLFAVHSKGNTHTILFSLLLLKEATVTGWWSGGSILIYEHNMSNESVESKLVSLVKVKDANSIKGDMFEKLQIIYVGNFLLLYWYTVSTTFNNGSYNNLYCRALVRCLYWIMHFNTIISYCYLKSYIYIIYWAIHLTKMYNIMWYEMIW